MIHFSIVCVRACVEWGGVGHRKEWFWFPSLVKEVSVLMERERACRILCVSSLDVRDAGRKCSAGRWPKPPVPSSSFVSGHGGQRGL